MRCLLKYTIVILYVARKFIENKMKMKNDHFNNMNNRIHVRDEFI